MLAACGSSNDDAPEIAGDIPSSETGLNETVPAPSPAPSVSALPAPARAPKPAPIGPEKAMLVLDGSGSMWGKLGEQSKMQMAREAAAQIAGELPEGTHLGLMAFGHRNKTACDDIEILQPPGPDTRAAIPDAADQIKPTGKTPLTAAVRRAAKSLGYRRHRARIIVLADGVESCRLDPCKAGAELEAAGADLTVHLIGLGLSQQEREQIACLAENTGGRYVSVNEPDALTDIIGGLVDAEEGVSRNPASAGDVTLTVPGEIEIGSMFDVTWAAPDETRVGDFIDIVPASAGGAVGASLRRAYIQGEETLAMRAPALPGPYLVRYVAQRPPHAPQAIAMHSIEVRDAEVALLPPSTVHVGQYFSVDWKGPGNKHDYIDIAPRGHKAVKGGITYRYVEDGATSGTIEALQAPKDAQELDVRYISHGAEGGRVLKSVPLRVEDARAEVSFNPDVERGAMLEVYWIGPNNKNDYIDIVKRGSKAIKKQLSYVYLRGDNPVELKVPGGTAAYDVRYIMHSANGERILARAPLTLSDVDVALDFKPELRVGDALEVEWSGPQGGFNYIDIVRSGSRKTHEQLSYRYTDESSNVLELKLPKDPGTYDVRFVLSASDGEKILLRKPLTLTDRAVSLDFPRRIKQGLVLEVATNGPRASNNYVDITPRGFEKTTEHLSYQYVREGERAVSLNLPAKPGEYDVRFVLSGADGERILTRAPLTVTDVPASVFAPETATAGETIEVEWKGPGGKNDFVDVVARGTTLPDAALRSAFTRRGNVVELTLPDDPGAYDVRYILHGSDGRIVKAVSPIDVK